jgi:hypothetical protein
MRAPSRRLEAGATEDHHGGGLACRARPVDPQGEVLVDVHLPWRPNKVPRDLSVIVHILPAGNVLAATGNPRSGGRS